MKNLIATLLLLFLQEWAGAEYVPCSSKAPEPDREFRAMWVATVHNIDWPSSPGLPESRQKAELIEMLNTAASTGINAVIFQVRTECDALYESKFEPWSHWLTGQQGKSPGYDPLAFAVEEAHKRGIELHAWFNPFRASATERSTKSSSHITKTHSSLMLRAGTQVWANPASPYVRQRAVNVITDVVSRYDIDGVHMDDYFYPYPVNSNGKMIDQFDDSKDFNEYRKRGGKLDLKDWRRSNIDSFVQALYRSIKSTRSSVKFGISPFGIWRPGVPKGIDAKIDAYDHLAADSRAWLRNGLVDYLSPQLYWRIDDKPHSFMTLSQWWASESVRGRHVWPGIASNRILSSEDRGRTASESLNQINITRTVASNQYGSGHIHWSYEAIKGNKGGLRDQLAKSYANASLIPSLPWINLSKPEDLWVLPKEENNAVLLQFRHSANARWRVIQVRDQPKGSWKTLRMIPGSQGTYRIGSRPFEIAMSNLSATGILSDQTVIQRK